MAPRPRSTGSKTTEKERQQAIKFAARALFISLETLVQMKVSSIVKGEYTTEARRVKYADCFAEAFVKLDLATRGKDPIMDLELEH